MSRYTEREISIEAVKAVQEYGELSMSKLITILTDRMDPTGHDADIIANRNDTYFSQKVRNLRSHRNQLFFENVHYDGRIDKYVSNECQSIKEALAPEEYAEKIRQKKEKVDNFYARKLDYEQINQERKLIGNAGEELVYRDQLAFVRKHAPEYMQEVRHVSKLDGDGAGYDICSINGEKQLVYIEVKSTTGKKETPFYMSASEYAFLELHKENYSIARVYEFDKETGTGKIEYIPGAEIENKFEKKVSSYKIMYKE